MSESVETTTELKTEEPSKIPENLIIIDNNPFVISCPHCGQFIEVLALNCRIFRCGIYKN